MPNPVRHASSKTTLRAGTALALVVALASAGLPAHAESQNAASEDVSGEIRVTWWGGPSRHAKTNAVIDLFQQHYPNVAIDREIGEYAAYWDKLAVQAAGQNQPCVIQLQTKFTERLARNGVIRPLNDLVDSGQLSLEDIAPGIVSTARLAGDDLYLVPYGVFVDAMVFNRTMFEEAGVEPPSFDWTWDDFVERTSALAPKLPEGVAATDLEAGEAFFFMPYVLGQGEALFDEEGLAFPKQIMIDWYEMWEGLREAGVTESADERAERGLRAVLEDRPIARGTSAIGRGSLHQLGVYREVMEQVDDDVLDSQKIPNGPAGPGDIFGANGFGLGSTCTEEQLPAATAFINFFTHNPEAAAIFQSDNGLVAPLDLRKQQAEAEGASDAFRRQVEHMILT